MIQSLRKKFILINMLLVLIVLLIVFSTLCIASYKRLQYDNIRTLEMALSRRDDQRPPRFEVGKEPPSDFMRDPVFVIYTDTSGHRKLIMSDNISISDERLILLVDEAEKSGADSGILWEHNLRYLKRNNPHGMRIAQ